MGQGPFTRQQRGSRPPYRKAHKGKGSTEQDSVFRDQVRLERHRHLLKGLYMGECHRQLQEAVGRTGLSMGERSVPEEGTGEAES